MATPTGVLMAECKWSRVTRARDKTNVKSTLFRKLIGQKNTLRAAAETAGFLGRREES